MEELTFDGAQHRDVVKWLQFCEDLFDREHLQATRNYAAVSHFLTGTAAIWFKHTQSRICDWFTFKREIIEFFHLSSSPLASDLLDRHLLAVKEELQKLGHEQAVSHVPASSSTMSTKELDNDNISFDSINETQIKSREDLENKGLHESEQERYLSASIYTNDIDLEISQTCSDDPVDCNQLQQQAANVTDDCNQLEQHNTNVTDDCDQLEQQDTSKRFTQTTDSLAANDSLINTVLPQDIQYLRSKKNRSCQPRIINRAHAVYDCNQYHKKHHNKDTSPTTTIQNFFVCEDHRVFSILKFQIGPPYEDIAFAIGSKAWDYLYDHEFRCYSHKGTVQLRFSFRKWKYRCSTLFSCRKWKYRPLTYFLFVFLLSSLVQLF